ncbi:MAG: CP12 domain-containing protein [Pontimonas sp.]
MTAVRHKLYGAIRYAYETCHKKRSDECAVAWGEVEELSRVLYKLRVEDLDAPNTEQDRTCLDDPGHPECREYDV